MISKTQRSPQAIIDEETPAAARDARIMESTGQTCMLLQLPGELRDLIWIALVSSIRLTFGNKVGKYGRQWMKPPPFNLSIFRLCKQINEETKNINWINHVLFNFEEPESMLDKLTSLPPSTLSQIRHIRLNVDEGLVLRPTGPHSRVTCYRAAAIFMLLPSLCLDRLTLIDDLHAQSVFSYDSLRLLIEKGNGWKVLQYITAHPRMLGFGNQDITELQQEIRDFGVDEDFELDEDRYLRVPQPGNWIEKLLQRDGENSRASVTIYRSTIPNNPDAVMNPSTREIFEQKVESPMELEKYGVEKDTRLTSEEKSLLVVVKRGSGANVSEPEGPPYSDDDIRQWGEGLSWPEIKMRIHSSYRHSNRYPTKIDRYDNVDEFDWINDDSDYGSDSESGYIESIDESGDESDRSDPRPHIL